MKSRSLAAIAAAFALFASYGAYRPAAAYADERVLSGELVVLKGTTSQFRIVDNDGTYSAPSGVSLEPYDGKAVRVTVNNGRVTSIEPQNLDIRSVEHTTSTVQGQLAVGDAVNRTFTIAGDPKVYVAPSYMDIRPYNGRMVQVRLDDSGQVAAIDPVGLPAGPALSAPVTGCSYGGQNYSEGSAVCQAGSQYRCEQGAWRNLGTACGGTAGAPCESDGLDYADGSSRCVRNVSFLCENGQWRNVGTHCRSDSGTTASRAPSCLLGGATLANGSFICRDGQTMRCNSGAWVSVGKACS